MPVDGGAVPPLSVAEEHHKGDEARHDVQLNALFEDDSIPIDMEGWMYKKKAISDIIGRKGGLC